MSPEGRGLCEEVLGVGRGEKPTLGDSFKPNSEWLQINRSKKTYININFIFKLFVYKISNRNSALVQVTYLHSSFPKPSILTACSHALGPAPAAGTTA